MPEAQTKPCEYCGTPVTKTATQQSQRKYWTCSRVCANRRRIQLGHTPGWAPNRFRGQKDTRPCAVCSKPVTRYVTEQNHEKAWTCSQQCMGSVSRRRLLDDGTWTNGRKPRRGDTIPCSVCGTPFYRQPAYIKQGRHLCSRVCNRVWQTKPAAEKTCAHCGAPISVKPSQSHRQFCSQRCSADHKIVRPTGRTHNGRPVVMNHQGYLTVYEPTHPAAPKNGRVLEHRLIVEKRLGRYLRSDEHVDHINQDKADNRDENLQVLSPTEHQWKTVRDKERAIAKLKADMAAYEAKYGPLSLE